MTAQLSKGVWASEKHKPGSLTPLQQDDSMQQSQSSFKYFHYFPYMSVL